MKRFFVNAAKFVLLPVVALLAATGIGLLLLRLYVQHRTAARIRINSSADISSIEKIQLGGVDQWIQIRGHDRTKPLLLFLHGGPGFPQMPFSHLNAELEKTFVVVEWDQRGAGKSYAPRSIPGDSMNIAQFVADTHELTQLLLRRFGASKCYLVAHSWGSMVGALTVARYPDLFYAYVSLGQLAGLPETQQVRYQFALDTARRENNRKAVAELDKIGPPPHQTFDQCKIMEKWVHYYAGREHKPLAPSRFAWLAFESPAYSWSDLVKIPFGFQYSYDHLWREIFYKADLFEQAPRIEVPVYFLLGRYDEVVTTNVTKRYFDVLDAPRGKHLIWFEGSGHWPHFEEPQKYRDLLIGLATSGSILDF